MSNGFKFEKFAYQPDPEFDDYEFVKFEELKNKTIVISGDNCRIEDESVKFAFRFADNDEVRYCTYTKAKAIVRTLQNIFNSEGVIPAVPVMIGTYPTGKGNDGYCFKDVED